MSNVTHKSPGSPSVQPSGGVYAPLCSRAPPLRPAPAQLVPTAMAGRNIDLIASLTFRCLSPHA